MPARPFILILSLQKALHASRRAHPLFQLLRWPHPLRAFLIFPIILMLSSSVAGAGTRLAIGTFGLNPGNRDGDLADLIAVRLSATPDLDLVERRELTAVLKEWNLSLGGFVRVKDAVRAGALLRADQFLLGSSVPINGTNQVIVRLVDARSGVIRAINVFREPESLDTLAAEISGFVLAGIKHPPPARQDYLAIGVIQNLGVNNRF